MKKILKPFLLIIVIFLASFTPNPSSVTSNFCGIRNTAFKDGEVVTMKVYYTLGAYIAAGEATFSTNLERFAGKTVYHFVGEGKSYPFFDNFFKVRDRYESYVDTATL